MEGWREALEANGLKEEDIWCTMRHKDLTEIERAGARDRGATSHVIWRRNLDDQARRPQKIRNERDEDAEMGSRVHSLGYEKKCGHQGAVRHLPLFRVDRQRRLHWHDKVSKCEADHILHSTEGLEIT
ncbi:hypothetical protein ACOME3_006604 [Neoechinorhynchus agilis]